MPYYLVEWKPTLVPKYKLKKAKGLVDKFEARLQAKCKVKNRWLVADPAQEAVEKVG